MENFSMYLIVMVYFLSIAFLGYLGYKKTKDSKDFLIGGGEMNPIVMALSYGATFISASQGLSQLYRLPQSRIPHPHHSQSQLCKKSFLHQRQA